MSADFWAGYLSGIVGIIVGNPLDLLKTRLQASQRPRAAPASSSPPPPPQQQQQRTFDRAGTLLRGAAAPVLTYGALNALLFTSYNRSLTLLDPASTPAAPSSSLAKIWVAGAAAGLATFVVSAPTELVKCRAQVLRAVPLAGGGGSGSGSSASGGSGATRPAPSSWAIAAHVLRSEGLPGLYRGGGVTAARDAIGYGFYFYAYELSRRLLSSPEDDAVAAKYKVLLYGGIAGVVTWVSIFPLDVVKTRVQTQEWIGPDPERAPLLSTERNQSRSLIKETRRKGAVEIARQAYREEGVAVFFRGLGICTVRGFIVSAVQFFVYEWIMELFDQGRTGKSAGQT